MKNRKHLLLVIIFVLSFTLLIGLSDINFFNMNKDVKNHGYSIAIKEEKLVESNKYPNDSLIKSTTKTLYYRVIHNTPILDKPNGYDLRQLRDGELLVLEGIDGEYGIFRTLNDDKTGYVNLGDLMVESEDSIIYGVSTVNKVIKNDESVYVLAKGEPVIIKESKESNFIILDDKESEFVVNNSDIEIARANNVVSRSLISRKSKSLSKVISAAYDLIGKPYVYGDAGKRGYDCSGLIYSIYLKELDIKLPRNSAAQSRVGTKVEKSKLAPGDLLFFGSGGISHVGLYIGEGYMIHASTGSMKVKIDSIETGYYKNRLVTATRIIN